MVRSCARTDVAQHGKGGEQIEGLEHHADLRRTSTRSRRAGGRPASTLRRPIVYAARWRLRVELIQREANVACSCAAGPMIAMTLPPLASGPVMFSRTR